MAEVCLNLRFVVCSNYEVDYPELLQGDRIYSMCASCQQRHARRTKALYHLSYTVVSSPVYYTIYPNVRKIPAYYPQIDGLLLSSFPPHVTAFCPCSPWELEVLPL